MGKSKINNFTLRLTLKNKETENTINSFLKNLQNYETGAKHFTKIQKFKSINDLDNFLLLNFKDWEHLIHNSQSEWFTYPFLLGLWHNVNNSYSVDLDLSEVKALVRSRVDFSNFFDFITFDHCWWVYTIGLRVNEYSIVISFDQIINTVKEEYYLPKFNDFNYLSLEDTEIKKSINKFLVAITSDETSILFNHRQKFEFRSQLNDFFCKHSEDWVFLTKSKRADWFIQYFLLGYFESITTKNSLSQALDKIPMDNFINRHFRFNPSHVTPDLCRWMYFIGFLTYEGQSKISFNRIERKVPEVLNPPTYNPFAFKTILALFCYLLRLK
jgi:hypothetical protein